jgi:hypothetical protein
LFDIIFVNLFFINDGRSLLESPFELLSFIVKILLFKGLDPEELERLLGLLLDVVFNLSVSVIENLKIKKGLLPTHTFLEYEI